MANTKKSSAGEKNLTSPRPKSKVRSTPKASSNIYSKTLSEATKKAVEVDGGDVTTQEVDKQAAGGKASTVQKPASKRKSAAKAAEALVDVAVSDDVMDSNVRASSSTARDSDSVQNGGAPKDWIYLPAVRTTDMGDFLPYLSEAQRTALLEESVNLSGARPRAGRGVKQKADHGMDHEWSQSRTWRRVPLLSGCRRIKPSRYVMRHESWTIPR